MARVHLWGELRRVCGGVSTVEVEAADVRQLIEALEDRYPALRGARLATMTVAIDGELMNGAEFQALAAESEVHFLQPMSGG